MDEIIKTNAKKIRKQNNEHGLKNITGKSVKELVAGIRGKIHNKLRNKAKHAAPQQKNNKRSR